jgi:hypothetical protein
VIESGLRSVSAAHLGDRSPRFVALRGQRLDLPGLLRDRCLRRRKPNGLAVCRPSGAAVR